MALRATCLIPLFHISVFINFMYVKCYFLMAALFSEERRKFSGLLGTIANKKDKYNIGFDIR